MKTRTIVASCLTVACGLLGAGTATAATTDVPVLSHQAEPGDSTTASVTISSSDALAGESLTVLILKDDADAADPAADDVVFIEQYELDDAGTTDFQVQLPSDVLEDYDIALNTAADTERYLAPLVGADDPGDGSTQDPDDEASPDPDEDSTTAPDDGQGSDGSGSGTDGDSQAGDGGGDTGDDAGTDSEGADSSNGTDNSNGADNTDASGDQSSDDFLANTGANIAIGVLIALAAIGVGALLVLRRRKTS